MDRDEMIARLEKEMLEAATKLDFELAASLRDRVFELRAETASGVVRAKPPAVPSAREIGARPAPGSTMSLALAPRALRRAGARQ